MKTGVHFMTFSSANVQHLQYLRLSCSCSWENGKLSCSCSWENQIPLEEIEFLKDLRTHRKINMSSSLDKVYANKILNRLNYHPPSPMHVDRPSCSYSVAHSSTRSSDLILENWLRPKNKAGSNSTLQDGENPNLKVDDPSFMPRSITGGKNYTKKRKSSISINSCSFADRRHTSIRQQSDQILAFVGEKVTASRTTVIDVEKKQDHESEFLQLHYVGRKINGMDRYVFVAQFYCKNSSKTGDKVVGLKLYLSKTSVNSEAVFHTIIVEVCGGMLNKIYSVMSDTCRVNTGKKTGINKRLRDYLDDNYEHDIHSLGCMFHINEIYLSQVIGKVEGKNKGPIALEEGSLLNKRFSADFDYKGQDEP